MKDPVYVGLAHPLLPTFFLTGIFRKYYNFVYSCKYAKLSSGRSQFTTVRSVSEERRNKQGKGIEESK